MRIQKMECESWTSIGDNEIHKDCEKEASWWWIEISSQEHESISLCSDCARVLSRQGWKLTKDTEKDNMEKEG